MTSHFTLWKLGDKPKSSIQSNRHLNLAYGFHWSIFSLQQTLNNQELSAADVERMKHEKRELQKAIEQLEKGRDYFDQQIWEKEMQYAKKHEEVSLEQQKYLWFSFSIILITLFFSFHPLRTGFVRRPFPQF